MLISKLVCVALSLVDYSSNKVRVRLMIIEACGERSFWTKFNFVQQFRYKMPKEQKKRGRREQKKRKHLEQEEYQDDPQQKALKRHKPQGEEDEMNIHRESYHMPEEQATTQGYDIPFFGLLDEDEQTYFKSADAMLELNQFENTEERDLFLASVYREAEGKELKIANSQSCSRFMERLIMMSNSSQLKTLFQKFNGQ